MSLYRGAGGASDATDDSTVNAVAGYASSAASSASAAAASATTATNNATAAATSASQAASSTSSAATSASNAATSASNAASSASSASSSASSASTSATNASNSAGNASTYASEALGYRNTASTHATNAASSASAAAGSATSAANSAASALAIYGNTAAMEAAVDDAQEAALTAQQESQAASDSAIAAAESEDLAFEYSQNAAESATTAQSAANSSIAASTSANAAWDQFDDRYLGAKAADPTVDNDGNALITGALYFNTSTSSLKVYTGSVWTDAYTTGNGFLVANNNLSDLQSAATARTNLGLGTAALENSTALVHTTGDETIAGTKTFTSTITGSVSGNAGTVTNGVYTTGDQTIGGTKTFSSTITGSISGNAGTVTNGVYTTGDQTIAGTKTFSSNPILSAGTVNGVAYLNGSKVLTTGSALTFDGTTLTSGSTIAAGKTGTAGTYLINRSSDGAAVIGLSASGNDFVANNGASGNYIFNINSSEQMRLTSTGLGIGTSSPAYKLDVTGTARISAATNPYLALTTSGSSVTDYVQATSAGLDLYTSGARVITFSPSGTERMRLNSSGNLGLGVTPSAWNSAYRSYDLGVGNLSTNTNNTEINVSSNTYRNASGNWVYKTTAAAAQYTQSAGGHYWYNAASGTAGNAITFTQAMTLDASGNLVGGGKTSAGLTNTGFEFTLDGSLRSTKSSTSTNLATNNGGSLQLTNSSATNGNFSNIGAYNSNGLVVSQIDFINVSHTSRTGAIAFLTHDGSVLTERARIDSSGNLLVGTTSVFNNEAFNVTNSGKLRLTYFTNSHNTSGDSTVGSQLGSNCNDTSSYHFFGTTGGADRIYIYGNGNVVNTNNSYGSLSDIKLKENITDATSKLEQLQQVRVVNYNLKSDPEHKQIGVIAQELEQIFPSMVDETVDRDAEGNDLGTTTKSVKYSVFVPMLIKAIQEQQALITQLTERITALEGK